MERLAGIAAAEGISIGPAFVIDRRRIKAPKYRIKEEQVEQERARFKEGLERADQQLQRIKEKISWAGGEDQSLILEAHQLILKDEHLVGQTLRLIGEDLINAEWALRRSVSSIKRMFDEIEDDYFSERRSDVDFVADHLLTALAGKNPALEEPPPGVIVIAYELSPADMARFYRCGITAVVTDRGSRNSHTAIIARSLGIPTVAGVTGILQHLGSGDRLIVDGYRGEVLLTPDSEEVRRYQRRQARRVQKSQLLHRELDLATETTDGLRIRLLCNIELSDEIPNAFARGAEGIGLYRTEFLFLGRGELPSEEDHFQDALQVLEYSNGRAVTFRTCDLGVDKLPGNISLQQETNPALGLRSIRLCLNQLPLFKAQLRGLLRAATRGQMQIMFPMISGVQEFREAKAVLLECKDELTAEGIEIPHIPIGIMVEMPSAAIVADLLAREVDFFSIGTNDLTQYALAVDRVNDKVNTLFRPLHPAILRLIAGVVQAAEQAKIPVTLCGEMASDPLVTLILLGLGVRELSMSALAVPQIKKVIRGVSVEQCRVVTQEILALSTSEEIKVAISRTMGVLFPYPSLLLREPEDDDTQI